MNKSISFELPEALYISLEQEAERLDIAVDSLLTGLVKKFLQKQRGLLDEGQPPAAEDRRASPRLKIAQSAILYFKTDNGRYGLYKTGDLKELAQGGALLECDTSVSNEDFFRMGVEFELIFQVSDEQVPLYMPCRICRVIRTKSKTTLGVNFTCSPEDENYKVLMHHLD